MAELTRPMRAGISLVAAAACSPDEVDRTLEQAVAAGAPLLKPGQKVVWGGDSGYFADPDGFLWEVAWNPDPEFPVD